MEEITREWIIDAVKAIYRNVFERAIAFKTQGFMPNEYFVELDARSYHIVLDDLKKIEGYCDEVPLRLCGLDVYENKKAVHPTVAIHDRDKAKVEDIVRHIRFFSLDQLNSALAAGGHPEIKIVRIGDPTQQ